jgi:hypothetical protein
MANKFIETFTYVVMFEGYVQGVQSVNRNASYQDMANDFIVLHDLDLVANTLLANYRNLIKKRCRK